MNTSFERNPELDKMIDEYHLSVYPGGKVGTKWCPNSKLPTLKKLLLAHKSELLTYIPARERWEKEEEARKVRNFESIPGLRELRTAREKFAEHRRKFQAAWERGDGRLPGPDNGPELEALEREYPDAVFALTVYAERTKTNVELAGIAKRAYERLRDGEPIAAVRADYDAEKSAFAERHLWD